MMGGVCFHPAGCLTSIPVLELAGYWVWPGLGVKMMVSRRAHASQYSLRPSSPVSLLSIVSHIPLLSPQETYQDPQTGPDQALMKSLFCAEFQYLPNFVCALQKWTLFFPKSCGTLALKPCWPSKPNALGFLPPSVRPSGWEAWDGSQNSHCWGRNSVKELFSTLWGIHLVAMVLDYALKLSILLSCDFFYAFSCKISFFGVF